MQCPFLAEAHKARQLVRGFFLVELAAHPPAVLLVVQGTQDGDDFVDAADLGQGLVDAVLPRVGAQPQQRQGRRDDAGAHRGDQAHDLIPVRRDPVHFNGPGEDRVQVGGNVGRGRSCKASGHGCRGCAGLTGVAALPEGGDEVALARVVLNRIARVCFP